MPQVTAAQVFSALGDPMRRRILEFLGAGEQPVGAIVDWLATPSPISQPAVSQHLKVLRNAGLATIRVEGTRRIHALDPVGLEVARSWLAALADPLASFAQPLDALATEVARGRRTRSETGGGGGQEDAQEEVRQRPA